MVVSWPHLAPGVVTTMHNGQSTNLPAHVDTGFLRAFMQAAATILALTMFMAVLWARST